MSVDKLLFISALIVFGSLCLYLCNRRLRKALEDFAKLGPILFRPGSYKFDKPNFWKLSDINYYARIIGHINGEPVSLFYTSKSRTGNVVTCYVEAPDLPNLLFFKQGQYDRILAPLFVRNRIRFIDPELESAVIGENRSADKRAQTPNAIFEALKELIREDKSFRSLMTFSPELMSSVTINPALQVLQSCLGKNPSGGIAIIRSNHNRQLLFDSNKLLFITSALIKLKSDLLT